MDLFECCRSTSWIHTGKGGTGVHRGGEHKNIDTLDVKRLPMQLSTVRNIESVGRYINQRTSQRMKFLAINVSI